MIQGLGIHLAIQGMQVWVLVWELRFPHTPGQLRPHASSWRCPRRTTKMEWQPNKSFFKKWVKDLHRRLSKDMDKWPGFPGGLAVNNLPAKAGDLGLIPGSGRSPEKGNGNPLQYSCLRNPTDRGAWQDYSPWGSQRVGYNWATEHTHTIGPRGLLKACLQFSVTTYYT